MAKKSRRPVRGDTSSTRPLATLTGEPQTVGSEARTRRTRSRRARQQGLLERYRSLIIGGAALVGVLIIGYLFLSGSGAAAYTCSTQLTPGPVESLTPRPSLPPTPTPPPTATPAVTPAPTAAGSPPATASPATSPAASPAASPGTSPAASPGTSPAASAVTSPGASPVASGSPTPSPTPQPEPTARLGFTTTILGNQHISAGETVNYGFCPPTSGDHLNAPPRGPIPAAFYPPNEEKTPTGWVHNLEHGYVAVLYRCPGGVTGAEGCPTQAELDQMRQWFDGAPAPTVANCAKKVLVGRFDAMSTRFALVAWGRAYLFDEFDLDTAMTFAEQWMEHDAVPENNAC